VCFLVCIVIAFLSARVAVAAMAPLHPRDTKD
jgi:hypothetical protein